MENNKELLIGQEKIKAAHYQNKAAFTNYLPKLSATGTYIRNQKEISILNDEQKAGLSQLGTTVGTQVKGFAQQLAVAHPELAPLIASLGNFDIATPLNAAGNSIVDAFRTDTRNMYAGAITLTQPLYMGGKIRAYNKITQYAEELARQQHHTGMQEVILSTDQAYWQVISLVNKKKLAEGYLKLLQKLESDVDHMIAEGVATKADGLSVKVKVNEAEMTLTKVEDGLSLSKMLLCQLCGLDLSTNVVLADENMNDLPILLKENSEINMETAYASRPELKSLELASLIYKQKVNVTRAEHLPTVALLGNYLVSNPSVYNGFENKFKGMWNVGVMVQVPIWNWGEGVYKTKAAKAEAQIAKYQLQDAREKVELQVNQAAFKVTEAKKKLIMASKNLEKANENLRYATLGFEEGVIAPANVLEAHTAWLSAQSEKIDAQIDIKLTEIYLQKSLGTLK
jgi:Outer membrane protein